DVEAGSELPVVMNVKTGAGQMANGRLAALDASLLPAFPIVAAIGKVVVGPHRCEAAQPDCLQEIRAKAAEVRQMQNRMNHPLGLPRLLEVGETKSPCGVCRIDHIPNPKGKRLAPYYNLIPDEEGQRPGFVSPPGVADVIL